MNHHEKAQFVLGLCFRTQAATEKYMGAERLPEWTEYMAGITAESTRKRLPDAADQRRSLLDGLASMLEVPVRAAEGSWWLPAWRGTSSTG
ncbi:hypothetical protein [Streptomyces sp. CA-135486]|uniref:hypothetical protein n=1 Tax=Streptomyces sp. CA-135486 TaxID=3240049 RepID=UPI003D8AB3C6